MFHLMMSLLAYLLLGNGEGYLCCFAQTTLDQVGNNKIFLTF